MMLIAILLFIHFSLFIIVVVAGGMLNTCKLCSTFGLATTTTNVFCFDVESLLINQFEFAVMKIAK